MLKGLLRHGVSNFDTVVLPDVREKSGSLTNSLEFPLYFFLFVSKGLAQGRRLNLVGDHDAISQTLRLLRITLLGPTREELMDWRTETGLLQEWITASEELSLKDGTGETIAMEEFFNLFPFENDTAKVNDQSIVRVARDVFEVHSRGSVTQIDLNEDSKVTPPYPVEPDYVPGGLVKLGIEVLGGASGFTASEPCTGLA